MKFGRDFTSVVNFCLDQLCPPIFRDCYPLMYPIYRLAYGKATAKLLKYKDVYPFLTEREYDKYYALAANAGPSRRPTDLCHASIKFILQNLPDPEGKEVLEAGCGRGFLSKLLASKGFHVTGVDLEAPASYSESDGYDFVKGKLDPLPFPNDRFDIVTCTHVLEHVPDATAAVRELLRVAKRRIIIVLPRQREYRYCADLHVRYFPYAYDIFNMLPKDVGASVKKTGPDWGVIIEKEMK